jgi:hypothetical protein
MDLSPIQQGRHACVFYENADHLHSIVIQYIKIGLGLNERCLYLSDPLSIAQFTIKLISAGVDVAKEVNRGALILTSDRAHLENNQFNVTRMIDFLDQAVKKANQDGFAGLRATGDVIWELGTDVDMEKLANYEKLLDKFFKGKKLAGLCQYNKKVIEDNFLCRALSSHKTVVLNDGACHDNHFYNNSPSPNQAFDQLIASLKI